jgi:peroxiredoxin
MRRIIFTILAALAISVLVVGVCQSKEKPGKSEKDVQAPKFTLKNYDGKEVSLSDYAGKIVVLEWFNYECPFVVYHYEKPKTMAGLAAKYKDKDVVWLAVNSTKHLTTEKDKAFAEEHKLTYAILDDRSGKVGRAYSAKTTPHMFIIDAKGKIVYDGGIDNSPMGSKKKKATNYVDKALAELAAGKAVSTPKTKPYGCSVKYAR